MTTADMKGKGALTQGTPLPNMDQKLEETEIDLKELFLRWFEHIKLIIFIAILGASIAAIYTFYFVTPMYQATAKLYVVNSSDSAINLSDLQIGTYMAYDYIEVFKTWEVHEMVIKNLGLNYTYSQMQGMITVENPNNTRIITITALSPSASEAAAIANEYANVAITYIADTMSTDKPNIMSVALVPTSPSSPNITKNILIGFAAGLAAVIAIITVRFVMDDKIKTAEDVAKYTGLPVMAAIPEIDLSDKKEKKGKLEE